MPVTIPPMVLNEDGQCPHCLRKPIPYKRDGHWFCPRCNRAYSLKTGAQVANWAWDCAPGYLGFVPHYPTHDYVLLPPRERRGKRLVEKYPS